MHIYKKCIRPGCCRKYNLKDKGDQSEYCECGAQLILIEEEVLLGSEELRETTVNDDIKVEYDEDGRLVVPIVNEIEIELLLADVKRLKIEAQEARGKMEVGKVLVRYRSIINIYKKLNKPTEVKAYEEILNKYEYWWKVGVEEPFDTEPIDEVLSEEELQSFISSLRNRRVSG